MNLDHPLLPEAEIRALIAAYRKGDNSAAERILAHNEKLIFKIANRYHATRVCGDVEFQDLMQYGRMGLLRALEDFDLERGTEFSTYAWNWIRQSISRYGRHAGQRVSMSYKAAEQRAQIGAQIGEFTQRRNRPPTVSELSELTGFTEQRVIELRVPVISLQDTLGEFEKTIGETIPSEDADVEKLAEYKIFVSSIVGDIVPAQDENIDTVTERKLLIANVLQCISELSQRSQFILVRFYGLDGKPPASMQQLAKRLRVSAERVRQIREAALAELRQRI